MCSHFLRRIQHYLYRELQQYLVVSAEPASHFSIYVIITIQLVQFLSKRLIILFKVLPQFVNIFDESSEQLSTCLLPVFIASVLPILEVSYLILCLQNSTIRKV